MEKINFRKEKIPFTQVANEVLYDSNLSAKAKGLYAYLYSKPDGWDFAVDRIIKEFSDGRLSINNGLKELEKEGYLIRERQTTGRVVYILKSQMLKIDIGDIKPFVEKPFVENRKVRKPQSAKTDTVSNTDIKVIKSISNTGKQSLLVQEVIKLFETVNPACSKMYGNTTQRASAENLIDTYGFEEVSKVISFLPKSNKMQYMPSITTPHLLWLKYQQLKDNLERKKVELQAKSSKIAF